jgi:hypothetical protein
VIELIINSNGEIIMITRYSFKKKHAYRWWVRTYLILFDDTPVREITGTNEFVEDIVSFLNVVYNAGFFDGQHSDLN